MDGSCLPGYIMNSKKPMVNGAVRIMPAMCS